jgi:Fe-S cluster assembly scaffold protein SufB
MKVIQQEAIAKAAGLSRDELAKSLIDKEALAKLSEVEGKDAQEKFNNLVKQVGMEEAKKRLGDETLAQQMESASVQDRFNSSVEKLKEVFVAISTVLMPIFDGFANLVTWLSQSKVAMGAILGVATALVGIQAALAVKSLSYRTFAVMIA